MTPPRLLLISPDRPALAAAQGGVERVLSCWTGPGRPTIDTATHQEVLADPCSLERCAALWLCGPVSDNDQWDLMSRIQDAHVPAVLVDPALNEPLTLGPDEGVLSCRPDADPVRVCAALQGLCSQTTVLASLRSEIKLLRAHQVGLADQIGKVDEELRLAAQFQREFLPKELPSCQGAGFHVLWRPAGYVSGDIYDVFRLDETHLGFFIADAVGHGVSAALMTIFIKRSLQTKRIDPSSEKGYTLVEPADALDQLNRDMVARQNGKVRFATACYGIIDTTTRQVRIARAGHPYPLLIRSNGTREMIEPEGGLLGVFDECAFEQATVQMGDHDRLLLYSDGFEMAFADEQAPDGKGNIVNEQYLREFAALGDGPVDQAFTRFEHKLDQQAGSLNQRDDLTVLCLAVEPHAASAPRMLPRHDPSQKLPTLNQQTPAA